MPQSVLDPPKEEEQPKMVVGLHEPDFSNES